MSTPPALPAKVEPPARPLPAYPNDDPLELWRAQFARYDPKKYIILAPQEIGAVAPMHRPVLAVVSLDARTDDKGYLIGADTYPIPGSAGKYGLSKVALDRIAQAASIVWDWRASGRLDNGSNPKKVHYRAVGRIKNMDGQWRILIGDKELDLDVIRQELAESVPARWERLDEKKRPRGVSKEQWVRDTIERDVLQFRKHMLARAQSGAMNRAIRAALAIRSSYSKEELLRPFVVPKMVFTPDYTDPEVKRFMLAQATGTVEEIYGARPEPAALLPGGPPGPALIPEVLQDPDTGDLIDTRTGEVLRDGAGPDDDEETDGGAAGSGPPQGGQAGSPPAVTGPVAGTPTAPPVDLPPVAPADADPFAAPAGAPAAAPPDPDQVAWDEAWEAQDAARQVALLKRLMARKGYRKELAEPLEKFIPTKRQSFFEFLWKQPDAAPPAAPPLPFAS